MARVALLDDRTRVVAGLAALAGSAAGVAAVVARAVLLEERSATLVGVRMLVPALLALGGHLTARVDDDRGPVLLATLALGLVAGTASELRSLALLAELHPVTLGGPTQGVVGVVAGALAWSRRRPPGPGDAWLERLRPGPRAALLGAVVLLGLAQLYPDVAGPLTGWLQPLLAAHGGAAWPTLVAALGVALVAVVAGRATPPAGALAIAALAAVTLGQVLLLLQDVLRGGVAATPWLWLRLLSAVTLLVLAATVVAPRQRAERGQ